MKLSLRQIINNAKNYLKDDFVIEDIYWIIEEEFGLEKYQILLNMDSIYDDNEIMNKVKRAVKEPVGYIFGYQYFGPFKIQINKNVLIPRQETFELVNIVCEYIKENNLNILDIGTGSGCIAIALEQLLKEKKLKEHILASDISSNALEVAKQNAFNFNSSISFVQSDVLSNITLDKIDIIISNPPYIKKGNYIATRVLDNEPHSALFADEDGLEFYHKIISQSLKFNSKISYFFEISPDLEEGLVELQKKYLPSHRMILKKDINGFIRFCLIVV